MLAVAEYLGNAVDRRRHDGQTARERFGDDDAEGLVVRHMQVNVSRLIVQRDFSRRLDERHVTHHRINCSSAPGSPTTSSQIGFIAATARQRGVSSRNLERIAADALGGEHHDECIFGIRRRLRAGELGAG